MTRPSADAPRIFSGIGGTYDRVATVLSLGQDPRWRAELVEELRPRPGALVLDVATGTGMVANALRRRYGCTVIGIDQSADMLALASGRGATLVRGRAEALPFADETFDAVSFTYLLRYVDDPRATLRELARVLKRDGRLAALDFAVPPSPLWRLLWRLYTRVGLPLAGRLVSAKWSEVGAFLGPSIEGFARGHPPDAVARYWSDAGIASVRTHPMSLGGGVVMSGTKTDAPVAAADTPHGLGSAFYSLRPGGWRDYWTLLHPPYTAWHLSYVVLGAALAPLPDPRIVAGALLAFALAVGVGAHSFDELRGRPLGTRIPNAVLVTLGALGLAGAVLLGAIATAALGPLFSVFVATGAALVVLYAFEVPVVHSDVGFALGWGAFPVLATAYACGAPLGAAFVVALAAALVSLAQRTLSTRVRAIRRRAIAVSGEARYRDGTRELIDARSLIAAPEGALRLLWIAQLTLAVGLLLSRWV